MRIRASIFRFFLLAGIILLALGALVARLWYVQVAQGATYAKKSGSGSSVTVRIPAVRGDIMDRNGIPLVESRMSFDVDFMLPDMVTAYREAHGGAPTVSYRGTVHNMPRDLKEADVVQIVQSEVIPKLEKLGIAEDFNAKKLQAHYRTNGEVAFNYRQDLDFETMGIFSERNLGLPGVNVTQKPVRSYVYGSLAAHILGYVGMPNDLSSLSDIKDFNFYDPDMEGKVQIELFMNDYLKGEPGKKILQKDVKGTIIRDEVRIVEPKQGANVYLTIDARIQYVAEKALQAVGRGAAVVVDPNTGDILAMATMPSYDPNKFIPSIAAKDWTALNSDETKPLLNRAISAFAPGSTYKIATALAGLRAGIGDRIFTCSGGVSYGNTYMKCWIAEKNGSHGAENLESAIKNSCNAYFYQYGNAAGIDQIVAVGNMLGLGQKSGIPLSGENPGILPGPEYLARVRPKERWSMGYTANTSIGQGEVLASPLQMAFVAATVANGGTSYYPRLIDKVVAQDGKVLLQEPAKVRSNLISDGSITAEQLERVRKGMWKVVNEAGGTGGKARIEGVEVAGKTGTAQNWSMRDGKSVKDNHVWFIAFAPYENPKYAVAVIVQGAKSGGGVAAPIAAKILDDTMKMEKTGTYELAWVEPTKGNFQFVESVDFGRAVPAATAAVAEDGETAQGDATAAIGEAARPAAPNVREEADSRVKNKERKPTAIGKFFDFLRGGNKEKKEKSKSPASSGRR